MATRSKRPVEAFWFVLKKDQKLPAEEQSRFKFRPLTQAERMRAMDNIESVAIEATGERQLRFRSFQQAREIVITTLVDTENFPAGDHAKFDPKASREDREKYVELMEDNDVYAMGDYVFDHSTLGQDAKNC